MAFAAGVCSGAEAVGVKKCRLFEIKWQESSLNNFNILSKHYIIVKEKQVLGSGGSKKTNDREGNTSAGDSATYALHLGRVYLESKRIRWYSPFLKKSADMLDSARGND